MQESGYVTKSDRRKERTPADAISLTPHGSNGGQATQETSRAQFWGNMCGDDRS